MKCLKKKDKRKLNSGFISYEDQSEIKSTIPAAIEKGNALQEKQINSGYRLIKLGKTIYLRKKH